MSRNYPRQKQSDSKLWSLEFRRETYDSYPLGWSEMLFSLCSTSVANFLLNGEEYADIWRTNETLYGVQTLLNRPERRVAFVSRI